MRQRKLKWADEYIANTPYLVRDFPIILNGEEELEIGVGKGRFIRELAKANPNKSYYGLEIQFSCLAVACKKSAEEEIKNVKFCFLNARQLEEHVEGYFNIIYLNFSDPWPKARHENRRLTSPSFLNIYSKLLKSGGRIIFRTDNKDLFDYSVECLRNHEDYKVIEIKENFKLEENEIISEYEEKFRGLGNPIYKIEVERN